jgi:hypothetical protein
MLRLAIVFMVLTSSADDNTHLSVAHNYQSLLILTSSPDCVSLVIVLICCFSSDLQNERPKHIMIMASISTISLIIVAAVNNPKVRYAFLTFGM